MERTIQYNNRLDIRNVDSLPRGTGARYLIAIKGQETELVAVRWARALPKRLGDMEILVDMKVTK